MIPKQAIEKAIEGKFDWRDLLGVREELSLQEDHFGMMQRDWWRLSLTPSFWQALAKALELSEEHFTSCAIWKTGECDCSAKDEWKEKAKEFYDLILERKGTTAFWEEILK